MKVLRHILSTDKKEVIKYLRHDNEEIKGLSKDLQFYAIIDPGSPMCDSRTHKVVFDYELTDQANKEYSFLKNANIVYTIKQLPNTIINKKLDESLSEWVNELISLKEQIDSLARYDYLKQLQAAGGDYWNENLALEKTWLEDVDTWNNQLKAELNNRKQELLINGIIPSFEWDDIPVKTFEL